MNENTIKIITGKCGGKGSWLLNPLSNAGPGFGSIKSLPPYSLSSSPSPSLLGFPGILSQKGGGATRRRTKSRRRAKRRTKRRTKRTKRTRKY